MKDLAVERQSRKSAYEVAKFLVTPCFSKAEVMNISLSDSGNGSGFKHHCIHDAEDRGVRADAQGQRKQGNHGKRRRLAQRAQAITQILQQCIHTTSPSRMEIDRFKWMDRALRHLGCLLRGFRFFDHLAVKEMDGPLSMLGKTRVVRHHADGCAFAMQALQQFHHGFAVA